MIAAKQIFPVVLAIFGIATTIFLIVHYGINNEDVSDTDARKPNILFIFSDDLGYNDVGFHNPDIKTPTIDKLATEGVILEGHYTQDACSPSRVALMTGKYPIRMGHQSLVIRTLEPKCLPVEEKILPEMMKEAGYTTHMIGKWHLGMQNESCLPTNRGFDTAYGYYNGEEDHWGKNLTDASNLQLNMNCNGKQLFGYDFMNNDKVDFTANGTYSTFLYRDRAVEIIKNHTQDDGPMFMYLSMQAPHAPLQVPKQYEDMYSHIENRDRRIYSGMVTALDDAIDEVVTALKDSGMYDNTIIVFSADNGGDIANGASNFPLRSNKGTMWEGAIRSAAFVGGALVKSGGRVTKELMHLTDWYPTLLNLAGVDVSDDETLDGVNIWEAIETEGGSSGREEILHNINKIYNSFLVWFQCGRNLFPSKPYENLYGFDTTVGHAALRWKNWKLLTGDPGPFFVFPTTADSNEEGIYNELCENDPYMQYNPDGPQVSVYLYDMENDPLENFNVAEEHHDVVDIMLEKLAKYDSDLVPYQFLPLDCDSDPDYYGGVFRPWRTYWNTTGMDFPAPWVPILNAISNNSTMSGVPPKIPNFFVDVN